MIRFTHYLTLAVILTSMTATVSGQPNATEIVRRADQKFRGESSYMEMTMRIVRPDWSREVSMKSWSKGNNLALVYITSPVRDRGAVFLKRNNEVWNWIPSVEKVIKIPPSMMAQSWMGSDFTNDDLVRESSVVFDYEHTLLGDTLAAERPCWMVELIPKPDAPVVWAKIILWISKEDDLELYAEYYDEQGGLMNTMTLGNIRDLGGREIPTHMKMIPADKPDQYTEMNYDQAQWDIPLEDAFFSEQNMTRVR